MVNYGKNFSQNNRQGPCSIQKYLDKNKNNEIIILRGLVRDKPNIGKVGFRHQLTGVVMSNSPRN